MIENTDIISKRAAIAGLTAAIKMHIERAETLAAEVQKLTDEIEAIENKPPEENK